MENRLQQIIADKRHWLVKRQQQQPLATFRARLQVSQRSFYQALAARKTAFILECKKASPSKGVIRKDFDLLAITRVYRQYADVISVLTDQAYFRGDYRFLTIVSEQVRQPVLCKDFIIDEYQILLARYYQADAVLLMLSVLEDEQYLQFSKLAHQLNMGVLTEVSNQQELERAITLKAKVIGINNRDLRDLSIDLSRTEQLAVQIPQGITVISESGIHHHGQVRHLSRYADGFLVGSALMAEADLLNAVRKLVLGDHKVCGLTRIEDAIAASQAGANYGGLIFVESSPRYVTPSQAFKIIASAPLRYVGVFRQQSIAEIVKLARQLTLAAVQLHGYRSDAEIRQLRQQLPAGCAIWQAVDMTQAVLSHNGENKDIARLVADHGLGGSGKTFDWQKLQGEDLGRVMLAGGVNRENCQQAAQLGCVGLDINSGAEVSPGIKSAEKLTAIFQQLRDY